MSDNHNPPVPEDRTLTLKEKIVAGGVLSTVLGALAGGLVSGVTAVPLAASWIGHSLSGWAGATVGLIIGTAINFWPIRLKPSAPRPSDATPSTTPIQNHTSVSDIMEDIGAVGGALVGLFTAAAIGNVVEMAVKIKNKVSANAESHDKLNGP